MFESKMELLAVSMANMILIQIKKAFNCWTVETFRSFYLAFVRPHLENGVAVWCPHIKKDIHNLKKTSDKCYLTSQRVKKIRITFLGGFLKISVILDMVNSTVFPRSILQPNNPKHSFGAGNKYNLAHVKTFLT